jgi:hypothetical protein
MFGDREGSARGDVAEVSGVVVVSTVTVAAATQTSSTGPVLAFAGAVLVAVIAAVTAGRRQRSDLTAAGARHTAELAADAAKLRSQLAHDRQLKDLDDLRAFFDEGATAFEEATDRLRDMAVALRRSDPKVRQDRAVTCGRLAAEQVRRADVFARRVALRFERDEPVAIHYGDLAVKLDARYGALLDVAPAQITDEQDEADDSIASDAFMLWTQFAAEARRFVGTAMPLADDVEEQRVT